MSILPEELTKLDPNNNIQGKIYDLRSQLSLKRRNDASQSLNKRQFINNLILNIVAMASMFVVYFASEEFYKEIQTTVNGEVIITKKRNESNSTVTVLRTVNIVLSITMRKFHVVIFIYKHYMYEVRKMIARKLMSPEGKK